MSVTGCPDRSQLQQFALGDLSARSYRKVAQHVEDCNPCRRSLVGFDGLSDELVVSLQGIDPREPLPPQPSTTILAAAARAAQSQKPADASNLVIDSGRQLAQRLAEGNCRIDKFELLSELGVGSFGYVFAAHDTQLDRIVALKVQRAGEVADEEEVQRFLREARSAAQLKHPGIVALYETGQTKEGVCFLVTEYIAGETLDVWLNTRQPDPRAAAELIAASAEALHYAHQQGIVHRDVKPSNILVDEHDQPHLMDFGLAKRETGEMTMTSEGRVMGTPAYMSPEQAQGHSHEVDARSDIYSLGVVLYEALTGERPFQGNRRLLLLQVLEDDPRPPRRLNEDVPRDVEVICLKAMAKSPQRRYQTAEDFGRDLRRFLRGEPIQARPTGALERLDRWRRRNPLAAALFLAIVLGLAAGVWYLSSLSEYLVRETASESARLETVMINEMWGFYSDLCDQLQQEKAPVRITENYAQQPGTLPFPASFAIDVGKRISEANSPMEVRVFSRYPWPGRDSGGPQDEYERKALEWLEDAARSGRADQPYRQFTQVDGRRVLLYATSIPMKESCVKCHNGPKGRSPKKDWGKGDVAGVLKIVRPLDREVERTRQGLRGALMLMIGVSGALLALWCAVVFGARMRVLSLES